jgi:hypothetical protein
LKEAATKAKKSPRNQGRVKQIREVQEIFELDSSEEDE